MALNALVDSFLTTVRKSVGLKVLVSCSWHCVANSFILSDLIRIYVYHKIFYLTWRKNSLANLHEVWQAVECVFVYVS